MAAGTKHRVTLFRGPRLVEKTITPVTGGPSQYSVVGLTSLSYEQKLLRKGWLGFDAPTGGGSASQDQLRDAALKLFTTDPTTPPAKAKKPAKKQ